MADDINGIINDHDYRLRMLEGKNISQSVIDRLIPSGGVDGDVLTKSSDSDYEVAWETPRSGYIYSRTVYFETSGTFDLADFLGIKAVRVRVVGGGGGGGGSSTCTTNEWSTGGGGGGGGYSEKFILVETMLDSETVTVGAGGSGGAAGNNIGDNGGESSFGGHCSATGGDGGSGSGARGTVPFGAGGGDGKNGSGGDLNIFGKKGGQGFTIPTLGGNYAAYAINGAGGDSILGLGAAAVSGSAAAAGVDGDAYGSGGSGGLSVESTSQQAGGSGASGIVIVDVFI